MTHKLMAIIEREGDGYVALCPEVDIVSQGSTVEEARAHLKEALELFFETASSDEIRQRLRGGVSLTHVGVEGDTEEMQEKKFIYYQEDDMWIGWLEEFPDYRTQGETLEDLRENLKDVYEDVGWVEQLANPPSS